MNTFLFNYIIHLADNALIHGHRLSEWCGHGPILEQDIALSNMALDQIGQCRMFYQYAAEIQNLGKTEDDLAYLRLENEYFNFLMLELPNGDWGFTMAKMFLYDQFMLLYYTELLNCKDEQLCAIAQKSLKEVKYHLKYSKDWILRLGDGTSESNLRIQKSINELWPYIQEFFEAHQRENELIHTLNIPKVSALKEEWTLQISDVLNEANLIVPNAQFFQSGGKSGIHTEHMGYILSDLQYLQRTYPNSKW